MNQYAQPAMTEATRLTVAGRLTEATRLIQQTLGNPPDSRISTVGSNSPGEHIAPESRTPNISFSPPMRPGAAEIPLRAPDVRHNLPQPPAWRRPASLRPFAPDRDLTTPKAEAQFVDGSYTNPSGTRTYKLYIPTGYTGQAVPLVVLLHGGTQTAVDFAAGTRMNRFAERDTFIVAYPEQPPSANSLRCWNWFQTAHQYCDKGEPSLIAGITRNIMGAYDIDVSRVYIAGFSAGGAMAVIMAQTYPDLYGAVGVHSGLAYGAAHDLPSAFAAMRLGPRSYTGQQAKAIPLILFHGDHDQTVAAVNADHILHHWSQGTDPGCRGGLRKPARKATVTRGQVDGGHAYTRVLYPDAGDAAVVEQWIIHKAGHAWSGGSPRGSYTDPYGPDASAELVRFFTEHPR